MFPETFVQKHLLAYSRPGELLFDPFCGRGTAILESLLNGRDAIGLDINPVAACVAGAKAQIPTLRDVQSRIDELERISKQHGKIKKPKPVFFSHCFNPKTLQQILFLKENLHWQRRQVDRFIAAMLLGVLHGESHRTELCLSNRMPRTISTKPEYSIRWWSERELIPPERDAFVILRQVAIFRLRGELPQIKGKVALGDARHAGRLFKRYHGLVGLIVTSPPYLDTTDYAEDQWLRLWFLGGPETPSARLHHDDRHTNKFAYWNFLSEVWKGSAPLLKKNSRIVVRIGGTSFSKEELFSGLQTSLTVGLAAKKVLPLHCGESSPIKRRQTNSFRPGTSSTRLEHDFVFSVCS